MPKYIEVKAGDVIEHTVGKGWTKGSDNSLKSPCTRERNIVAAALDGFTYEDGGFALHHSVPHYTLMQYWRDTSADQEVGTMKEAQKAMADWRQSGRSLPSINIPAPLTPPKAALVTA